MSTVFGRATAAPHPYDVGLAAWRASVELSFQAMARNMMHDHRVSTPREAAFDRFVSRPITAQTLADAVVNYYYDKVKTSAVPDFVRDTHNSNNFVTGTDSGESHINKDVQLTHIVDLSSLRTVYKWAKSRGVVTFESYPPGDDYQVLNVWLNNNLRGQPPSIVRDFVRAVLDAMNRYRTEQPFQPVWVATWHRFQDYVSEGPDRWLELFGMGKPTAGRWIIVLKYPARKVGRLVRPTQLDGGWYAFHFPSPPAVPLPSGGHPMDLRRDDPPARVHSEYIHLQIEHPIEHWIHAGELCAQTARPTETNLTHLRARHLELLRRTYGDSVLTWMPTAI